MIPFGVIGRRILVGLGSLLVIRALFILHPFLGVKAKVAVIS